MLGARTHGCQTGMIVFASTTPEIRVTFLYVFNHSLIHLGFITPVNHGVLRGSQGSHLEDLQATAGATAGQSAHHAAVALGCQHVVARLVRRLQQIRVGGPHARIQQLCCKEEECCLCPRGRSLEVHHKHLQQKGIVTNRTMPTIQICSKQEARDNKQLALNEQ